jgi:hypothetical protein
MPGLSNPRLIWGSTVLTHFPPENTYNSGLNPKAMNNAEQNFQEKEVLDEMLASRDGAVVVTLGTSD